jgi:YD repeat-containing protein
MRASFLAASAIVLLLATDSADAAKRPWEEYDKLIQASGAIGSLGPDLFGDSVNYYNNTLSFSVTDIDLPGNSALPVRLTRTYRVINHGDDPIADMPLRDWDLDIPRISGVYETDEFPSNRCDPSAIPTFALAGTTEYNGYEFWHGLNADMPGGGELLVADRGAPEPSLTPAVDFIWLTSAFTYFWCPATPAASDGGQAFKAITTDGLVYTFAHAARFAQPDLSSPITSYGSGSPQPLHRKLNAIYVTKVEDRFGNHVDYSYTTLTNGLQLDSIVASDGRRIDLSYVGGKLDKAIAKGSSTDGGREWSYGYDATGTSLTSVSLPGHSASTPSQWSISFGALSSAKIDFSSGDLGRNCDSNAAYVTNNPIAGTMTHPSGAIGEFKVKAQRHGRSNVPKVCVNWETPSNNPTNDIAYLPRTYDLLSIVSKTVKGPGLPDLGHTWTYSSGGLGSWASGTGPTCKTTDCLSPKCLSDDCAGYTTSIVVGPNGETVAYTFGTSYLYNEGKLVGIDRGNGTSTLESEDIAYELARTGQMFKTPVGSSRQKRSDSLSSAYIRPQKSRSIIRDGVTFSSAVRQYDTLARAVRTDRYSSLGFAKSETTEFHDVPTAWVMGQVLRTKTDGIEVSSSVFDQTKHVPIELYVHGAKEATLTYNADGTVATYADGKNQITMLDDWSAGVPTSISYPDSTAESAFVDARGWITSTTDENGTVTGYDYDSMGRLTLVDYTNLDAVNWASTTRSFSKISTAEFGLTAGHWKQIVATGNGRTTTFYDARWLPVIVLTEDTALASTKTYSVTRYDANGRPVFKSYPVAALTNYLTDALQGVSTTYDPLGRPLVVLQDSELTTDHPLGLKTETEYQAGFKTKVTNPRGVVTITQYQAFDVPSTDAPVSIISGEGTDVQQTTTIDRDAFGKPLSIIRNGDGS